MVGTSIDENLGPGFWWFAAALSLWLLLMGPIVALVLGLSFAAELLVVLLPAAGLVAIGAYIARPAKFRASADRRRPSLKTR